MDRRTQWETEALREGRSDRRGRPAVSQSRARQPPPSPRRSPDRTRARPEPAPPPDTMLVPLDAWNRMLDQLGNLHQAGQELSEARERAAKAETEATFLRERLAELRGDGAPQPVDEPAEPAPEHRPSLARSIYREIRKRVG